MLRSMNRAPDSNSIERSVLRGRSVWIQGIPKRVGYHAPGVSHSDVWKTLERVDGEGQVIGVKFVVVAEEHDEFGFRKLDQPIEVRGPIDLALKRAVGQSGITKGRHHAGGVIVRCVVGDHQRETAMALPEDTRNRPCKQSRSVMGGNADSDVDAWMHLKPPLSSWLAEGTRSAH